jgi:hypothetical protein
MRCDLLRDFQLAAILQVRGNAGRPKCMVSYLSLNSCSFRATANHPVGVGLAQGEGGKAASLPCDCSEQQSLRIVPQSCNLYICLYVGVEVVMGGNFMTQPRRPWTK